jgi:putative aminopeptidase FrvX
VTEPEVQARLARGQVRLGKRQAAIRELFEKAGCQEAELRTDTRSGNVICTLAGDTGSTITAGGHFDFVDRGEGIVDDWSGVSLLPSLYEALKMAPHRHTFRFVAFADEERGLIGSTKYVKALSKEARTEVRAFVNLDSIGVTGTKVWVRRSSPELLKRLLEIAGTLGLKIQGVTVDGGGDDDTHPFLDARIPVISIHSITQETLGILHSKRDRMEAVDLEEYYRTYRLVAFYLAYLDTKVE